MKSALESGRTATAPFLARPSPTRIASPCTALRPLCPIYRLRGTSYQANYLFFQRHSRFQRVTICVLYDIPASLRVAEGRSFVFIDIPASVVHFCAFHPCTLKDALWRGRLARCHTGILPVPSRATCGTPKGPGRNVVAGNFLDHLRLRAIVLTRRSAREVGRFLPQPQQYPHFAVNGAVQGGFLAQHHLPRLALRCKAGVPFYRRSLLVLPFGVLEFFPHAGDFLLEQTEKFLVFRLARQFGVGAYGAQELPAFLVGLLLGEARRANETPQQPENQPLPPPRHVLVKRFQYTRLARPEGTLLDLLPHEFQIRKSLSQLHPSIRRPGQVNLEHAVLGGVEGDTFHLLLAAVLPVVDRLQGAPLQACLRPLKPFKERNSKLEIRNSTGDSRFSIFEFRFSTSWRFSSLTYAPCFKPLSLEFCLAAGLRGPVECWAFWRAAASSAGVSWGDLRKDMVPPETGCWDSEERTSPRV